MLPQLPSDFLNGFYHIFIKTSENPLIDCKKILYGMLTNAKENVDPTKHEILSEKLTSITILLKLYQKLCLEKDKQNNELNFQALLNILDVGFALCDQQITYNEILVKKILDIFYYMLYDIFNNCFREIMIEFVEFYCNNLNVINNYGIENSVLYQKQLEFRLKLVHTCCSFLIEKEKNQIKHQFLIETYKKLNQSNGSDILINLLFNCNNKALLPTLLETCTIHIKYFKCDSFSKKYWKIISDTFVFDNYEKFQRILLGFCCLLESNFLDLLHENEEVLSESFLSNHKFWETVQLSLTNKDLSIRKQGIYLMKKVFALIENCQNSLLEKNVQEIGCQKVLSQSLLINKNYYLDIISILEYLEEQQSHIVEPIFEKINSLVKKFQVIGETNKNMFIWIIVIHQRALDHESVQVVKWALKNLLSLPQIYYTNNLVIEKIIQIVVPVLNNLSLFYGNGFGISELLINFFNHLPTWGESRNRFFSLFLNKIVRQTWSPEALFFVSNALSKAPKVPSWTKDELLNLKLFILQALKTYNKTIKLGIQYQLLISSMNLIDLKVPVSTVFHFLSSFFSSGAFDNNTNLLHKVYKWIKSSISKSDVLLLINDLKTNQLQEKFNEETIGFTLVVLYYTYGNENGICNYLMEMMSLFKSLNKRPYFDESLCKEKLLILHYIIKTESISSQFFSKKTELLQFFSPFLKDVKLYIQSRINVCSSLQDFLACQLLLKTYKNILKIEKLYELESKVELDGFFKEVVSRIEYISLSSTQLPPVQIYGVIKIIQLLIEIPNIKLNLSEQENLFEYVKKNLNVSLTKEEEYNNFSKDVQILWGKLNSKHIKAKWKLFENFTSKKNSINNDLKTQYCVEGLRVCGYRCLSPVMKTMGKILQFKNDSEAEELINLMWQNLNEGRRTRKFKNLIQEFVEMLYSAELVEENHPYLEKFVDKLFDDPSAVVVKILSRHFSTLHFKTKNLLEVKVICKSITYGKCLRKDEKLALQIKRHVKSDICSNVEFTMSKEIRSYGVSMLIKRCIDLNEELVKMLDKIFWDVNGNEFRYFANSEVHRIKERVMQAFLVIISMNGIFTGRQKILDCVSRSLKNESSQPSVRILQEIIMIYLEGTRIELYGKKPKSICSYLTVKYHFAKHTGNCYTAMRKFIPFCMDQNFEVRLYSQVLLKNLFHHIRLQEPKFEVSVIGTPDEWISESFERANEGNAGKNILKLQNDFFLNGFDPSKHMSLETIYTEIPRLTGVESEEWISGEDFRNVSIVPENIKANKFPLSLLNKDNILKEFSISSWTLEKNAVGMLLPQNKEINEMNFCQKKIVPDCGLPLISSFRNQFTSHKGKLIIVASLLDRIPNLGGLARTCEIFGVSEFVINSLNHVQNKEFTSLSVTAEKWITTREVKIQNLTAFIVEMKDSGYTVVGAEQATQSQSLSCVKFPKKTLLLLGNEKAGIPPYLLPYLDICVEVPQLGIIRSLNVHVTGALFIWEYAKQHSLTL